jgi:hypothetical protein
MELFVQHSSWMLAEAHDTKNGTGVFFRVADKYFVVTARHIVTCCGEWIMFSHVTTAAKSSATNKIAVSSDIHAHCHWAHSASQFVTLK